MVAGNYIVLALTLDLVKMIRYTIISSVEQPDFMVYNCERRICAD